MQTKNVLFFAAICLFFLQSCAQNTSERYTHSPNGSVQNPKETQPSEILPIYAKVSFFNESAYTVSVHKDAFSGVVIAEVPSGGSKITDVAPSENHGIGTTFCIKYRCKITDEPDLDCGDVWAEGIDPNIQMNIVLESNKNYTVQIPQPTRLVFETAFLKLTNASSRPCELKKGGLSLKQTGNGNLSVQPYKIGVYKIPASAAGSVLSGYSVNSVFANTVVPEFGAEFNSIYSCVYDGSKISQPIRSAIVYD